MSARGRVRILTWNVNGIRARLPEVIDLVRRERPDVACLQEIKAAPEQVPGVLLDLPDYWHLWHGAPGGYSGVSLHVRKAEGRAAPAFTHPAFDMETRVVECRVDHVRVASVYAPNGNKDYAAKITFLRAMAAWAADARRAGDALVVCGDLNVARAEMDVHPKERRPAVIGQRPEERALFEEMLGGGDLVDVGRALAPDDDRLFTWWPYWREARQKNVGWRLDYVLASSALAGGGPLEHAVLREHGTSDHGAVLARVGA